MYVWNVELKHSLVRAAAERFHVDCVTRVVIVLNVWSVVVTHPSLVRKVTHSARPLICSRWSHCARFAFVVLSHPWRWTRPVVYTYVRRLCRIRICLRLSPSKLRRLTNGYRDISTHRCNWCPGLAMLSLVEVRACWSIIARWWGVALFRACSGYSSYRCDFPGERIAWQERRKKRRQTTPLYCLEIIWSFELSSSANSDIMHARGSLSWDDKP